MLVRTVFLVGLGLILIGAAAWDVGNPTRCERASDLVADNRLAEARTEFVRVLKGEPSADCAVKGLRSTVIAQCAAALRLKEAGRDKEALKAYLTLATTEPMPRGVFCAYTGLRPVPPSCEAADRQAREGLLKAAHAAYTELAAASATRRCAALGLADVRTKRCAAAKELADAGMDAAAEKAFAAIAASEPIGSMTRCIHG